MIQCTCGNFIPAEWPICPRCEHDFSTPQQTMSLPQNVTIRYATNLLNEGANDTFELDAVAQMVNKVPGGDIVGFYYEAAVKIKTDFETQKAAGATPRQAVKRALEKHGVTFQ